MTLEELRLMRLVQGILVRNYVDTQKLDVEVIGSSVYIEGEFRVFEYHPSQKRDDRIERDLSLKRTLLHIEQQIRSLGEVSHLEMKFTNWERHGLEWVPKRE
jgi:signal transduction histidine kinase